MTSPSESQVYYNTLHTEHQEMNVLTGEFGDNKQTEIEKPIVLIERSLLNASNISNEPFPTCQGTTFADFYFRFQFVVYVPARRLSKVWLSPPLNVPCPS